jgi:hypothetical protein
MRRLGLACGLVLSLNLLVASQASADTFTLNDIYCNCLPAGTTNGGTVTINDAGNDVQFIIDLNDLLNFHYSNAFDLFAFNYSGSFAESTFSITSALPAGWSLSTTPLGNASMAAAGKDFDLYLSCASCTGQGGGISGVNQLTFTLHSTAGNLDPVQFETVVGDTGTNNNDFAASVTQIAVSGCTGVIGGGNGTGQSTPQASTGGASCGATQVPDGGSTLGFLGLGMLAVGYLRRRSGI